MITETQKKKITLEFKNYLDNYYLCNKFKPEAMRRPSTHEVIEWWFTTFNNLDLED
jgi:hypothetical protein